MTLFNSVSGTLLNALTVLLGGLIGVVIGDRLPKRMHESLFAALGLFTVLIGLLDALATKNPLILLGSLLIGTVIGEAINIDAGLNWLGERVQRRFAREGSTLAEAFVTSSLVFCVGPLSILGALDNGLTGDTTKLVVKATLDGFAALAFGATLGPGVLLSILTILLYQGALSLGASALAPILTANQEALVELTATGGLILVAIGLRLLKIRELRAANFLPALLMAPLLVAAVADWPQVVGWLRTLGVPI
jgi:uncharacterized membrane protein YqgA involved in biofilm formation